MVPEDTKAPERQVRASPEVPETVRESKTENKVVSMAVDSEGEISKNADKVSPRIIRAKESSHRMEADGSEKQEKKEKKEETNEDKKDEKTVLKEMKKVDVVPHVVVAAKAPEDEPAAPAQQESQGQGQQEEAKGTDSWKSAFFFFASLLLVVILAGTIAARLYMGQKEQTAQPDKLDLKSKSSGGAAALQHHLNDSSSTSDSGEKIAMLFDRVRKSLEDLGDQAPNDAADVAGAGKGSTNQI